MEAALDAGAVPRMSSKLRDFLSGREETARYGGFTSAAAGLLHAAPKHAVELDCRHDGLKAKQADKDRFFGKQKLNFTSNDSVGECVFSAPTSISYGNEPSARDQIRMLRRELKQERKSRRDLEMAANDGAVGDEPRGRSSAIDLPRDWFESRDATGRVVWVHMLTHHSVYQRPTADTPIAPTHAAIAARADLPAHWYETRDAEGRPCWRNVVSMTISYSKPGNHTTASFEPRRKDHSPVRRVPLESHTRAAEHLGVVLGKAPSAKTLVGF